MGPLLISEVSLKTMERKISFGRGHREEKPHKEICAGHWQIWNPIHPQNSPEHMGLATSHHAFPLCPAKLIQEWLSSSDSICRQNKSASLNTPSALIGQAMEGRKWLYFSLLPFVNAEI